MIITAHQRCKINSADLDPTTAMQIYAVNWRLQMNRPFSDSSYLVPKQYSKCWLATKTLTTVLLSPKTLHLRLVKFWFWDADSWRLHTVETSLKNTLKNCFVFWILITRSEWNTTRLIKWNSDGRKTTEREWKEIRRDRTSSLALFRASCRASGWICIPDVFLSCPRRKGYHRLTGTTPEKNKAVLWKHIEVNISL